MVQLLVMQVQVVQFSSVTQSCPTLCNPMNHSTPGLPVHQLPEFTQIHVYRDSNAIQPSHPLLSPSPPASNPSSIRVFSNESILHMRWPKYWTFSFSIIPSKEIPGLIWMDWLDLLAVQGTLKSLLQHHSSKALILRHSAFFTEPLTVWITINYGKFWKRWEYQTTWSASWEICMQVRKQQLELDMEQQTGSK